MKPPILGGDRDAPAAPDIRRPLNLRPSSADKNDVHGFQAQG